MPFLVGRIFHSAASRLAASSSSIPVRRLVSCSAPHCHHAPSPHPAMSNTPPPLNHQTSTFEPATVSDNAPAAVKKRQDYLPWADYFMAVAFLSAQRSKDPSSQVGACIVNQENKIVGIGYNGMPNGCNDDLLPWARTAESPLDTKYMYVCHAELNAVLNKNASDVKGCTIYVALFPCNECAKIIIQSGIKEVIYKSDKYHDRPEFVVSRRLFDMAGIKYRQHIPKMKQITIDFGSIE